MCADIVCWPQLQTLSADAKNAQAQAQDLEAKLQAVTADKEAAHTTAHTMAKDVQWQWQWLQHESLANAPWSACNMSLRQWHPWVHATKGRCRETYLLPYTNVSCIPRWDQKCTCLFAYRDGIKNAHACLRTETGSRMHMLVCVLRRDQRCTCSILPLGHTVCCVSAQSLLTALDEEREQTAVALKEAAAAAQGDRGRCTQAARSPSYKAWAVADAARLRTALARMEGTADELRNQLAQTKQQMESM
eukprot:scaffold248572_cov18-Tisochrysis_lutea.AAC.1